MLEKGKVRYEVSDNFILALNPTRDLMTWQMLFFRTVITKAFFFF